MEDELQVVARHFDALLGLRFVSASPDRVVVEWTVDERHRQPWGIVHGGVHCSAIETVCSYGAVLAARQRSSDVTAVGLENHTSFIRGVREGTLKVVGTPITRGRRTQVWEAEVTDEAGRVVATGRVRLLVVPANGNAADLTGALPDPVPGASSDRAGSREGER